MNPLDLDQYVKNIICLNYFLYYITCVIVRDSKYPTPSIDLYFKK